MRNKGIGPPDLFDSAWLKWGRAIHHVQSLRDDLDTWQTSADANRQVSIATEYNAKRRGFVHTITAIEPYPLRWGLMLGDAAFDFRACLDHIAWAMVTRARLHRGLPALTDDEAKQIYFPICDGRKWFNRELSKRMPGVLRADAALVRVAQPYHKGPTIRPRHVFRVLSELNNHDKHRVVQPVASQKGRFELTINNWHHCIPIAGERRGRVRELLQVGAEAGFTPAKKTGDDPYIEMDVSLTARPVIAVGLLLTQWADLTALQCERLLAQLANPPEELAELGVVSLANWMGRTNGQP